MTDNVLYYGDNLTILREREYFSSESVDLVYLDPPFNSNANYNVLFEQHETGSATAQFEAFADTWRWDIGSEEAYVEVVESGGPAGDALKGMRQLLGQSDMMAYVAMIDRA